MLVRRIITSIFNDYNKSDINRLFIINPNNTSKPQKEDTDVIIEIRQYHFPQRRITQQYLLYFPG